MCLAAQVVELPEAILCLGVAMGEEEIVGVVRADMGDTALVTNDGRAGADVDPGMGRTEICFLGQIAANHISGRGFGQFRVV